MKPLIFSVEDDLNIQNVIKIALENTNFDVKMFDDAKSLFAALKTEKPNLFLLDVMLPDVDGLEIVKAIRDIPNLKTIPIMIVSAKASEIDRVIGLDTGADDYLVKPFGVLELVSRIKALLRRTKKTVATKLVEVNGLKLDGINYLCTYLDKEISLTKKQFELLKLLMENHNQTIERDQILEMVWGYDFVGESRTLDVHIKELRKKLKGAGIDTSTIETVRGVGYKFVL